MGTQWVRQEIKKNPLAEWIDKRTAWIKTHREASISAIILFFAAILLSFYLSVRYSSMKNTAWEKFFIAQQYSYDPAKLQDCITQLHAIQTAFSRTDAAGYSILFEGDLFYKQGQMKEAIEAYNKLIKQGSHASIIPFAMYSIGKSYEAMDKWQEAITAGRAFLDKYPDHYLAPLAHDSIARCFEKSNNTAEAKSAYEKIALLFPDTSWAQKAQQKINYFSYAGQTKSQPPSQQQPGTSPLPPASQPPGK